MLWVLFIQNNQLRIVKINCETQNYFYLVIERVRAWEAIP